MKRPYAAPELVPYPRPRVLEGARRISGRDPRFLWQAAACTCCADGLTFRRWTLRYSDRGWRPRLDTQHRPPREISERDRIGELG